MQKALTLFLLLVLNLHGLEPLYKQYDKRPTLELIEIAENEYHLKVEPHNLPRPLFLQGRLINQQLALSYPIELNEECIVCHIEKKEPIVFNCGTFLPGELFEFDLLDVKKKLIAQKNWIPKPHIKEDSKGHSLQVIMTEPTCNQFFIHATGYKPRETLTFLTIRGEHITHNEVHADAKGNIVYNFSPAIAGEEGGCAVISIGPRGTREHLSLPIKWGKAAFTSN